jgi:drug/metabolite transporter (DMT)-like permease
MKDFQHLQPKTYISLLIIVTAGPVGNVFLADGMKHVGKVNILPPTQLFHTFLRVFASPAIWLGIASLMVFFVVYMLVLSWADYSFVQPATSIAYGVVALLGYFALGEAVSPLRWIGIGVICTGVFLVGGTRPETTREKLNGA